MGESPSGHHPERTAMIYDPDEPYTHTVEQPAPLNIALLSPDQVAAIK